MNLFKILMCLPIIFMKLYNDNKGNVSNIHSFCKIVYEFFRNLFKKSEKSDREKLLDEDSDR